MVIHDLKSIGAYDESDLAKAPLPATEALVGYLYYVALRYGAVARLGYSFWAGGRLRPHRRALRQDHHRLAADQQEPHLFRLSRPGRRGAHPASDGSDRALRHHAGRPGPSAEGRPHDLVPHRPADRGSGRPANRQATHSHEHAARTVCPFQGVSLARSAHHPVQRPDRRRRVPALLSPALHESRGTVRRYGAADSGHPAVRGTGPAQPLA